MDNGCLFIAMGEVEIMANIIVTPERTSCTKFRGYKRKPEASIHSVQPSTDHPIAGRSVGAGVCR
jgi:hypothetical protein